MGGCISKGNETESRSTSTSNTRQTHRSNPHERRLRRLQDIDQDSPSLQLRILPSRPDQLHMSNSDQSIPSTYGTIRSPSTVRSPSYDRSSQSSHRQNNRSLGDRSGSLSSDRTGSLSYDQSRSSSHKELPRLPAPFTRQIVIYEDELEDNPPESDQAEGQSQNSSKVRSKPQNTIRAQDRSKVVTRRPAKSNHRGDATKKLDSASTEIDDSACLFEGKQYPKCQHLGHLTTHCRTEGANPLHVCDKTLSPEEIKAQVYWYTVSSDSEQCPKCTDEHVEVSSVLDRLGLEIQRLESMQRDL